MCRPCVSEAGGQSATLRQPEGADERLPWGPASLPRDFPAAKHWPKLGFVPVADRPGKSASGHLLTTWVYSFDQPTLFAAVAEEDTRARAVLDANILYDLQDYADEHHRGMAALSAAWLSTEVEFCLTTEVYVEIDRSSSAENRDRRRKFAQHYTVLSTDESEEQRVWEDLRPLFPPTLSVSDRSDLRHLAKAVAGGAQIFITWDAEQLGRADAVRERYGLAILRPMELVIGLDARLREAEYVPTRVAGCLTTISRVGAPELDHLQAVFQDFGRAEARGAFVDALHAATTDLRRMHVSVVTDPEARELALFSIDLRDSRCLRVPLLRLRRGRLADGLAEHIVWRAVTQASEADHWSVEVTDPFLAPAAEAALRAFDFHRAGEVWRKYVLRAAAGSSLIEVTLRERAEATNDQTLMAAVSAVSSTGSKAPAFVARLERTFWPLKILGTDLPTWVVPIRPAFAAQLFDEALASQDLFGAKEHLALSFRNVYYRSARGVRVPNPSRILWYVSTERGYQGSGSIRAVSLVEETVRGSAKELFKRFQRLGAYEWRQILLTAEGDPSATLEAFTFTHTELFPEPIPFRQVQEVLSRHERAGNRFPGPVAIPDSCFAEIYLLATRDRNLT